ncbi:CAP domain-containing protein [Streptomyces gardneri]|uniref:CAP domain-containing protein n=1 Tax=Streptomyces gardneri TaxID=66892 RepID=UPI000716B40D|nr:CAP domain-containing protein [Streptomyces gardneri]WRK41579.1 CAP domain-containing protein [Streptomyces venezuelae]
MQRTMDLEQLTDTELVRAAQYGDPWAREQLVAVHQPLVSALAARALDGRPGADAAVDAIVRDTLGRAEFALGTLPSPEAFRPWLIAMAVNSTLGHAAAAQGLPTGPAAQGTDFAQALRWLDVEDTLMVALWSLEEEGWLSRYETAAALNWTPQDTAIRMDAVRIRLDAARSVTAALARTPRCGDLDRQAAGWAGEPSAPWRDHLARHTAHCAYCATGMGIGASVSVGTVAASAVPGAADPTETCVLLPDHTEHTGHTDHSDSFALTEFGATAAAADRRSTRASRRRRRQADERTRRRAAVAAGIAVAAVTGGVFALHSGREGNEELYEANRATASGLDIPLSNEPGALTASPPTVTASPSTASASASPSPAKTSASASASASPSKTPAPKRTISTPTKSPRPTANPATKRPTTPTARPDATPSAQPTTTAPTGDTDSGPGGGTQQDTGQSSAAEQVIALVNAERAKAGCGALSANATLTKAAQGHSDDMAARDYFDHTNPDGDGPGERVTAAGYPWSTYGENIAMGQSTPEQVMEGWMNSPGHRANILNCDFKEIGIGIHTDGGPYWTQVFGAR